MSDQGGSPGPGYWQATDGNWYPPERHPDYRPPAAQPPPPRQPAFSQQQPPPQQRSAPATRSEAKADAKAAAARAKAMRPWFKKKRFWLLGVVAIIVIAAVAGGGGDDKGDGGGGDGGSDRGEAVGNVLAVGETDNTSGLDVTLLTVETPFQLGQFESEPEAGQRYIGVELSVTNTTDEDQVLSTLVNTELKDSTGQRFNVALVGLERPQIDGTVLPGDTLRGWAVFEVPNESTGLQLIVRGSLTASGVRFDLGLG